jgi:alkyl hydroperoxide reductase subunit AhpC
MPLDLFSTLPSVEGKDQHGIAFDFKSHCKGRWAVIFSYPADFTPVCSTEMIAFSKLQPEFERRNCRIVGISPDSSESHARWLKDVESLSQSEVIFPVVADVDGIAIKTLKMSAVLRANESKRTKTEITTRCLYIVDSEDIVQFVQVMPQNTGRDLAEILRVLDSVQLSTLRQVIATPADWQIGSEVVILPHATEDDVKNQLDGSMTRTLFPYLRFAQLKQEEVV